MAFGKKTIGNFIGLFFFTLVVVVAGNFLYASFNQKPSHTRLSAATLYPTPKPLGSFSLLQRDNGRDRVFDTASLKGKWHIVFMGYSSCPNICPMEMQNLRQLYLKLPEEIQEQTQVVMVTTDPLRDSPEVMADFVTRFHPGFIGLSGNKGAIAVFAKQFSMPFFPAATEDATQNYEVNHSATFYLTNPDGQLHAVISTPHNVGDIYNDLLTIIST